MPLPACTISKIHNHICLNSPLPFQIIFSYILSAVTSVLLSFDEKLNETDDLGLHLKVPC